MKTPQQIADELQQTQPLNLTEREMMVRAIKADRKQWADMAAFGRFVYDLMEEQPEWNSGTFEDIASYAANVLKRPFSEPLED